MGKKKRGRSLLGIGYMLASVFLIYTLLNSGMSVYQQKEEIASLTKQRETLEKEQKELENEIELLHDEDYVTRYARENYTFSREGEKVFQIPSN